MDPQRIGPYELVQLCALRGLLRHFRARDRKLERCVLLSALGTHPGYERRARLVAAIDHPHLLRILDAGTEAGTTYVASPWIGWNPSSPARDLSDYARCVRQVAEAADAVQSLHENGLLHLNLQPDAILIHPRGHAVLADIELITPRDDPQEDEPIAMGTPAYAAPEQMQGRADERTDVYGLGALLYGLLLGQAPHARESSLAEVTWNRIPRPRSLCSKFPRRLESILAQALAADPASRYRSVADFLRDLEKAR